MSFRRQALTLLVSSALAGALVYAVIERRNRPRIEAHRVPTGLLAGGESAPRAAPGSVDALDAHAPRFPRSTFRRRPLSIDELTRLFRTPGRRYEFDPQCYTRLQGSGAIAFPFAEHPDGEARSVLNSLGLKNEREVRDPAPELRVWITGDSHTFGVGHNAECFPALLEERLRSAGRDAEALNAGVGGYTFQHYLGALERYLPLEPDVAVFAIFAGNDFESALTLQHYFAGTRRPAGGPDYIHEIEAAAELHNGAVYQSLLSVKYFSRFPDQIDVALQAARDVTTEIVATCARNAIHPVFVYIPAPHEVAWRRYEEQLGPAAKRLGLTQDDLETSSRLGDSYLAHLRSLHVDCVDLREDFRTATEPMYWSSDLHISPAAHRVIAERLAPLVDAALPRAAERVRLAAPPVCNESLLAPGAAAVDGWRVRRATPMNRGALGQQLSIRAGISTIEPPRPSELAQLYRLPGALRFDANALLRYRDGLDRAADGLATTAFGMLASGAGDRSAGAPRAVIAGDECAYAPTSVGPTCGELVRQRVNVETLDAITLGASPANYLATLARSAPQHPRACVVLWNSANDFHELEELRASLAALRGSAGTTASAAKLVDVAAAWEHPETLRRAGDATSAKSIDVVASIELVLDLRRRCREAGVAFSVVLIPHWEDSRLAARRSAASNTADPLEDLAATFFRTLVFEGVDILEVADELAQLEAPFESDKTRLTASGRDVVARVAAERIGSVLGL